MFKKLLCLSLLFAVVHLNAQVLTIGSGAFTSTNFYGPMNSSTNTGSTSRYAYIYPAVLVSSLRHGDTIRSIEFHKNSENSLSGTVNFKIYMRNTSAANYGNRNVVWANQIATTGMTKVFDANIFPVVQNRTGWVRFQFSTPYIVDTTLGFHLEILTEYSQSSTLPSTVFWSADNSGSQPGYGPNQTKFARTFTGTLPDSTNSSSDLHPQLRINFPRDEFDLECSKIYALGKLPVPLGNPDTVKAIFKNVGKLAQNSVRVFISSSGANNLIDSATISLASLEEKVISLPLLSPQNTGLDTIRVRIKTDDNVLNNTAFVYRIATSNVYSYKDPFMGIAGGIGFNGSSGDFVARFYSNTAKAINQVSVAFAFGNQRFQLGIWDANGIGGRPGTNIWTSDTLISATNFITPVLPPVQVNGNFYVGVRQLGTSNIAFGYQPEEPVRPNTFFYAAPYGSTNWIDFSPGAPFKFVIEPRIQATHDVAPLSLDFPKDTVNLNTVITMAPKATIFNYGAADQLSPFNITLNIRRSGSLVYTSTRQDTLTSLHSRIIVFDSTFLPVVAGNYNVELVTRLANDQMKDNDTLRTTIIAATYKDVGCGIVFDPFGGAEYEQYVDTIFPAVYIQNYGLDNQGPFNVVAKIYDSLGTELYSDVRSVSLTPLSSIIASFTPFACDYKGAFKFVAFTDLNIDLKRSNDSTTRLFTVVKSNDVTMTSFRVPVDGSSVPVGSTAIVPHSIMENVGDKNQTDDISVYFQIFDKNGLVYFDSVRRSSFRTIPENLLFANRFVPNKTGRYTMISYCALETDQYRKNDTIKGIFYVGIPDDALPVSFVSPAAMGEIQLNRVIAPKVEFGNSGFNALNTPFNVQLIIRQNGIVQYSSSQSITIDSGLTTVVDFESSFAPVNLSSYQVEVIAQLPNDFVSANDTLRTEWFVKKAYDVALNDIVYPTSLDTILANKESIIVRVEVENIGDSAIADPFPTAITIENSTGVVVFTDSVWTSLQKGEIKELSATKSFMGTEIGQYKIIANCLLETDQYRPNDTLRSKFLSEIKLDAGIVSTVYPVQDQIILPTTGVIKPVVIVGNAGTSQIADMPVTFKVYNQVSVPVYQSVKSISMQGGTQAPLEFDSTLTLSVEEFYLCEVYTSLPDDQIPQNDILTFAIRYKDNTGLIFSPVSEDFELFPNPATSEVQILLLSTHQKIRHIEIVNALGQVVHRSKTDSNQISLDVSGLSAAVYQVQLTTHDGNVYRRNLIKQ